MSETNEQNAAGVYVVAAAHYYGAPLGAVNQPNSADIEELAPGMFCIWPPNWEDEEAAAPLAVCRWNEDDRLWKVEVHTKPHQWGGEDNIVIVAWNEDDEEYTVAD